MLKQNQPMFKLSSKINSNKVFIVNRSMLEGRIEPDFYKPESKYILDKLRSKKHFRLKDVATFSSETWNQSDYFNETFPYIEISEVDLLTGKISNIKNVPISEAPSRAKMIVRKNDILISTTRPSRGAISFLKDLKGINIASTGFAVIRNVNEDLILREVLFFILRQSFTLKQMEQRSSGGNYPAITQEELGNILIPYFDSGHQKEILSVNKTAYELKEQKESEAIILLKSIDIYLMNKLGFALTEHSNFLKDRIFISKFSELTSARFDPFYFKYFGTKTKSHLYNEVSLKRIASINKGQSITKESVIEGPYPVIAGGQSSPYTHNIYNQESNVITVSASGAYAGFVWYHNQKIFASDCTVIRSKNENEVTTEFIFNVLKAKQEEIYQMQQGAGQPHVYVNDLEKLTIPLPDFETQKEINKHIQNIRTQANQLLQESIDILESAKKGIEKMILGNSREG